jgi:ribonuclease HI
MNRPRFVSDFIRNVTREISRCYSNSTSQLSNGEIPLTVHVKNIYCDGSFRAGKSIYGYSTVTDENGIDLLSLKIPNSEVVESPTGKRVVIPVYDKSVYQQNNYAELIALVHALKFGILYRSEFIYTDSVTALAWSQGRYGKKIILSEMKAKYINECSRLRLEFEKGGGVVKKVNGDDNVSDLGYHK